MQTITLHLCNFSPATWQRYNCMFFILCIDDVMQSLGPLTHRGCMFGLPGQSFNLGMGESGSRAVPRHLRTVCHILPGLLRLLLHRRVRLSLCTHIHTFTFTFTMPLFKPELCLLCQGLCGHTALWKDQLREAAGTLGAVVPATHANWYTEGKTKLVGAFSITSSLISAVNIGNCHLLVFYGWYMLSFKNLDELIILNQKVDQQQ